MRRFVVDAALALLCVALSGCPGGPSKPPGEVPYGEYVVTARKRMNDTCQFSQDTTGDVFDFWARLAVDPPRGDGTPQRAYLTIRQPATGGIEQAPRPGVVEDGALVFEATAQQELTQCDCIVEVTERIVVTFRTTAVDADGGVSDGGAADGGDAAPDGGVSDGGAPDAGEADGGTTPATALPDPGRVIGVGGAIVYQVKDIGGCDPESTMCTLPCGFEYGLTGNRIPGT